MGDSRLARSLDSTSTGLIARVRERDSQAWNKLVDLYGAAVYSWCRRLGLQPQDSADVVQQVFTKVWSSIERFDPNSPGATFRGWLYTVTRNTVRDFCRQAGRKQPGVGGTTAYQNLQELADQNEPAPSLASPGSEVVQRALRLIEGEFPAAAVEAFRLLIFEGQNASVTAARLNVTPAAVRQWKCRILRRLREELGDVE